MACRCVLPTARAQRPAFAHPLPAGAEVVILETRDGWLRIALADGTPGWVRANSVAPVRASER